MRSHLLGPEQAMMRTYYAEVNKIAWALRRVTGCELLLAMQMNVSPAMREDVMTKVKFLQTKHSVKDD